MQLSHVRLWTLVVHLTQRDLSQRLRGRDSFLSSGVLDATIPLLDHFGVVLCGILWDSTKWWLGRTYGHLASFENLRLEMDGLRS